MSLQSHCTPRPSAFAADRRATVLSLDTFLKGLVNGPEAWKQLLGSEPVMLFLDELPPSPTSNTPSPCR